MRHPQLLTVFLLLPALALPPKGAVGQPDETAPPPPSTSVELLVEAQTPSGRWPTGLSPADFSVSEDGVEAKVVAVRMLGGSSGRDASRRARSSMGRRPWTILIYVDAALLGEGSLPSLASLLAGQAAELTALGEVEVVLADPEPHVLLGRTRDPKLVRASVEGLMHLDRDPHTVVSFRRQYLDLGLTQRLRGTDPDTWDLEGARKAVLAAAERESSLVRRQLENLRWWLRSYPATPPKLLLWVTDGLDRDLAPFYLAGLPAGGLRRQLERDLVKWELSTHLEETATIAGALAWTTLPLWRRSVRVPLVAEGAAGASTPVGAPGVPAPGPVLAQESSLVVDPETSLREMAESTAGDVVGALDIARVLSDLNNRILLTYSTPRAADEALHRIDLWATSLRLRFPVWRSTPAQLPPSAVALRGIGGDRSGGMDLACSLADEGTEETTPGPVRLSCDVRLSPLVQRAGTVPPRFLQLTVFVNEDGGGRERIDRSVSLVPDKLTGMLRLESPLPPRLRGHPLTVVITGEKGGWAVQRLAPLATAFTFDQPEGGLTGALPSLPSAKAVYLTPFDDTMVAGPVLAEALVTRPEVVRVDFLLDGRRVASVDTRPFEAWVRLEALPEPHTLTAVALGAAGDELGRDEMRLNQGLGRHRVHIAQPTALGAGGLEDVEVTVETPATSPAPRVDLYWNNQLLVHFVHPPFRTRLELPFAFEGDYLRAVARFSDGTTDEDTLLKSRRAFSIKTDVEMIELYTVVTGADGRAITDLRPEEVRIYEEGRPQTLRSLERATDVPLRLALTIDISESMQPRMAVVKRAAQEFADTLLGPRDQALLAAFNHRPFLLQGPTGDPEILSRDIERLPTVGGTSLFDAIIYSLLQLRDLPGRKAVVLLTDGKDKHSRFSLNQALDFARQSNIPLYLIGPVAEAPLEIEETTALRRLAALTGGALYLIRSEHQLADVYAAIAAELRNQYVLAFQSDYDGRSNEWRNLEVRITRPGARARTMTGYYPRRH